MKNLFVDIESYSSIDLQKCGVYKYSAADDFQVLLFGYSIDGGEVQLVDLASGETIPTEIAEALSDPRIIKHAHNAAFERICLSRFLMLPHNTYLDPKQWRCTMVHGAYCGLPLSLVQLGETLKLSKQKLDSGKKLITLFCKPDKNGAQCLPNIKPEEWERFKDYNIRDVEAEVEIYNKLSRFPVPDLVWDEYSRDCIINDRGVLISNALVNNAVAFDERSRSELTKQMREITALDNPNSVIQLRGWLKENGLNADSLNKNDVSEMLKAAPNNIAAALELRLKLARSSVKKYTAMLDSSESDGRMRGLFQFYGSHTGRSSGRRVQLQNLARGTIHGAELSDVRSIICNGDYDILAMLYDNIPDVLSSLVRTALVPRPGCKFVVADFSAVEARVLAWLAGEKWVLDVFSTHGKIYEAAAARMYKCSIEKVTKDMRQNGKTATLACGYGGGVGSLRAFGADKLGMTDSDMQSLVSDWRNTNQNIVRFWYSCENAAKSVIKNREPVKEGYLIFSMDGPFLTITLPGGRRLFYAKAKIGENRFGNSSIIYTGVNMAKKWTEIETYGGRLVENVTQAVARDLLFHSIKSLEESGIYVVAHIHDECVCEVPKSASTEDVCTIMGKAPAWAQGLPLKADGYECEYYEKM